jgi:cytoskeletal protein CcmA (bactofilin family)
VFKRRKPDEPTAVDSALGPAGARSKPEGSALPGSKDTARGTSPDSGLGVPPFRPAPSPDPSKDTPAMARSPFAPAPATPVSPTPVPSPGGSALSPRPTGLPARAPQRDQAERRTLVVGRGISVQGTVQDAERLVVEGTVEASMIRATELSIAQGGMFKGEVEVEDAEIAGTMNGTLTARGNLVLRGSGRLLGTARCRRLQVEDGGQISGQMEMLSDEPKPDLPVLSEAT